MFYHTPFTQQPCFIQLQQLSQIYAQVVIQLFSMAPFFSKYNYELYKQWVSTMERHYYEFLSQDEGAKWFADQINATLCLFKPANCK